MAPASPKNRTRRRPGEIRDAIEATLTEAGGPLHVKDIHAAVTVQLGDVAESSVRSYLNLNAEPDKRFKRIQRGIYTLR